MTHSQPTDKERPPSPQQDNAKVAKDGEATSHEAQGGMGSYFVRCPSWVEF
jgi:hypothetical protein